MGNKSLVEFSNVVSYVCVINQNVDLMSIVNDNKNIPNVKYKITHKTSIKLNHN